MLLELPELEADELDELLELESEPDEVEDLLELESEVDDEDSVVTSVLELVLVLPLDFLLSVTVPPDSTKSLAMAFVMRSM